MISSVLFSINIAFFLYLAIDLCFSQTNNVTVFIEICKCVCVTDIRTINWKYLYPFNNSPNKNPTSNVFKAFKEVRE